MDAEHECLLLHTELRWLSRGKVLMGVFELKEELLEFYSTEGNMIFCELLKNEKWCAMLAYLANIFNYINSVNINMQGQDKINKYFPEIEIANYDWIRNPFSSLCTLSFNLRSQEEEELISISVNRSLKIKFSEESIEEFWISMKELFSKISKKALIILLQFLTLYLAS
ncbi:Hypothetical protein CINCED_3A017947 [Cinara cedri]|uniref:Zinc finger BED domain-containing protein 5 n=1 Tax=Cinara cedri TaxID=506608 RepID=A0A5E4NBU5_9HEMI|nr:Hypothetical protein CINCED_3A017947 [Cinara cedri]